MSILLLIVKLVLWFGWFCSIALAQLEISEALTGSVDLPVLGIVCIGNISVFITCFIRGRLDIENGAKEVLTTLTGPKLVPINGNMNVDKGPMTTLAEKRGVEGASVVMLSNGTPNSSMRQFLQFNAVDDVHSILLQYVPLKDVAKTGEKVNVPILECECSLACNCIAFWTNKQITTVLARRMPARTMKVLVNDSLCLLPCSGCLKEGCHECNQESLLPGEDHPDEAQGSTQRSALSDILHEYVTDESINPTSGPRTARSDVPLAITDGNKI